MTLLQDILSTKRFKLIAVLLLIGLAGSGFYFYRVGFKKVEEVAYLPCPVPAEYCKTAEPIPNLKALGFRLPKSIEIKAVTDGNARPLISSWGDTVVELRSLSGLTIFYIFQSGSYLNFTGPVKEGFVLGKSGETSKSKLYSGYNLVIRYVDKAGNYQDAKELFKQ